MFRFLALFTAPLVVLSFVANYPQIRELLIDPWNEWLAAGSYWIIQWFDTGVHFYGNVLLPKQGGGGISVESGCNGVEATLILVAAMLAFPGPWLAKILGILIGSILVQAFNLGRIISLYYLAQWNEHYF